MRTNTKLQSDWAESLRLIKTLSKYKLHINNLVDILQLTTLLKIVIICINQRELKKVLRSAHGRENGDVSLKSETSCGFYERKDIPKYHCICIMGKLCVTV